MQAVFTSLTEAEESAGLYKDSATIGFKMNWERLLTAKRLRYAEHRLEVAKDDGPASRATTTAADPARPIHRHKTALVRYDLSKPVRSLLEYGLIRPGVTFFDYGCGHGLTWADFKNSAIWLKVGTRSTVHIPERARLTWLIWVTFLTSSRILLSGLKP
jgi:hypothetical protein